MYANAQGTALNYPEAVKWYRLSAVQGQPAEIANKKEFTPLLGL
jgi:TPR repeat protein